MGKHNHHGHCGDYHGHHHYHGHCNTWNPCRPNPCRPNPCQPNPCGSTTYVYRPSRVYQSFDFDD